MLKQHPALKMWAKGSLLNLGNQRFEALGVVHRQVSQHLAVQADFLFGQQVHKLRVGQTLFANGRVDTGDPQTTVFSFLQLTTHIAIGHTFFYYVFGNGIYVFTLAIEAFGLLSILFLRALEATAFTERGIS
jgi:hypothetical protein